MTLHDSRQRSVAATRRMGPLLLVIAAALLAGCAGSGGANAGGAALASRYAFWPPPPNEPRVQFLVSYRLSADVESPRGALDRIIFGADEQVLPIGKPYGVDMWNGRIYICDITNPGVVILDLVKRETRVMVTRGVEQMVQPTDIAIASDGMKYVADRRLNRIFVFNASDQHIGSFGDRDLTPVGVAVHGNELYVPDFTTQSVLVMSRFDGSKLRTIGAAGGDDGQFIRPLGVDSDDAGNIFVTDVMRGRLQKFSADGSLLYARGQISDSPGNFVRPKHVAVDRDGIIYVVDAAFQNVQMFNDDGEILMYFGGAGAFPGSMSLPAGICVAQESVELFDRYVHPAFQATRLVIVTNQFGTNKVSVYALGRLREGRTVADIAPLAASVLQPALPPGQTPADAEPATESPTDPTEPGDRS